MSKTKTPATAQAPEKYSAPALSKGLDILELLATRKDGLRKSEIASALDRSVSEIFRMLAVLVDRGYVLFDPAGEKYLLSLRLFELAHQHPPVKRLTTVAAEPMARLADRLNQSAHLGILSGNEVLVIAQNDPPGNNITSVRLGARLPAAITATGAALISHLSATEISRFCSQLKDATPEQIKTFRENVEQIKQDGGCVSPSMVIAGVQNISAPITDYSGKVAAALTVPYIQRQISTDDPDAETTKHALMAATKEISVQLGANAADPAS
ncbi:IclR family transcriptional regulator [Profundibacter sp.]|uniref:IclR family transcriptional regulator n=1 Tax=Profundibacter sp. TaxID=3101071 RepID=UPI003D13571F